MLVKSVGFSSYCKMTCVQFSGKLTSASKEALGSRTSPNSSPSSVHGSRRGSISSLSSVSSVLEEKDDERIRCCQHCKDTLLKREQQIDEKEYTPEIVKLYEVSQALCYSVYVCSDHQIPFQESLQTPWISINESFCWSSCWWRDIRLEVVQVIHSNSFSIQSPPCRGTAGLSLFLTMPYCSGDNWRVL